MTLQRLIVTFNPDGTTEISVTYTHPAEADEPPNPGTKKRTTSAARMAAHGLRDALAHLEQGDLVWGGFGTNMKVSRDTLVVNRKEKAA
jgi:alanine racemase